jgi:predicted MFS family arabinose efflux permease
VSAAAGRPAVILALLGAAAFAGQWNLIFLAPVLPDVAADTGVSVTAAGQLVTVSGLVALVSLVALGPLSDRYGRKPLLSLGLVALSAAAFGSYLTSDYGLLMALRVLSGIGDALVLPSAVAAVADYFDDKDREVALNVLFIPIGAAAVVGLPIVVVVSDVWDWQVAFLMFAAVNLVTLIAVHGLLTDAVPIASAERSLSVHYRESYGEVLGRRAAKFVLGAAVLGGTVGSGVFIYAGAFFEDELELASRGLTALFAAFGAAYVVGGVAGAVMARRFPPRPIAIWSILTALVLLLPLVTSTEVFALTATLALVFSASRAPGVAALNNLLLELAPGAQGTAVSAFGLVTAAGYFLGAALGGVAIAAGGYVGMATIFTILAAVAAALLAVPGDAPSASAEPELTAGIDS